MKSRNRIACVAGLALIAGIASTIIVGGCAALTGAPTPAQNAQFQALKDQMAAADAQLVAERSKEAESLQAAQAAAAAATDGAAKATAQAQADKLQKSLATIDKVQQAYTQGQTIFTAATNPDGSLNLISGAQATGGALGTALGGPAVGIAVASIIGLAGSLLKNYQQSKNNGKLVSDNKDLSDTADGFVSVVHSLTGGDTSKLVETAPHMTVTGKQLINDYIGAQAVTKAGL